MPPFRKPRLLRRGIVDKYYLLAFIALLLYVLVVTSVAWTIEARLTASYKRARHATPSTDPPKTIYQQVNEMDLLRAGLDSAQRSLESGWRVFAAAKLSHAQLALVDVAFLLRARDVHSPSAAVEKIDALLLRETTDARVRERMGVLLSLASLLEAQRYPSQAAACRSKLDGIMKLHGARLSLRLGGRNWSAAEAPSMAVALQLVAGDSAPSVQSDVDTVHALVENYKTHALSRAYTQAEQLELPENLHWTVAYPFARVGGPSAVSERTLKYLELLLGAWLLGGREDPTLRDAYERGVEGLLAHLVGTATHTANHTFVRYWGPQGKLPLLLPESCAAAAVLARGIKHRAHRYTDRDRRFRYRDEDILATAEAIAASCYQMYQSGGTELDGGQAAYMDADFSVLLRFREKRCAIRKTLLRNCYELYEVTQDPMYAAWALRLMQVPSTGCRPTSARALLHSATYEDYIEELRYFTFLFQSMRCKLYKNTLKSDRACTMWPSVLVTKSGYLLHLKHVFN
ncbi:hypothetical protein STCU_08617 [Strigomonas culicis]|uniref:Uncharacterized protein n=1 Tax=Strigomonas culicis TaxID=28005 RepID=S9TSB6_9TRYP|nr:hypothetical protein STCU_08617 [Strigomonas culicis]|eukprot:EPY21282.1 hypothetical protein STCU_08617 [Strigomonas culicis]